MLSTPPAPPRPFVFDMYQSPAILPSPLAPVMPCPWHTFRIVCFVSLGGVVRLRQCQITGGRASFSTE
jgi:hypothetical protein